MGEWENGRMPHLFKIKQIHHFTRVRHSTHGVPGAVVGENVLLELQIEAEPLALRQTGSLEQKPATRDSHVVLLHAKRRRRVPLVREFNVQEHAVQDEEQRNRGTEEESTGVREYGSKRVMQCESESVTNIC